MVKSKKTFGSIIFLLALSIDASAYELSTVQMKELTTFSGRAMGFKVTAEDIKNVPSRKNLEELIATGINLNKLLCAKVTDIYPLKVQGTYEVTCVAYRNGSAKKSYVLDTNRGTAFEP